MTNTLFAILGLALWPIILITIMGLWRTGLVLAGKHKANAFSPGSEEMGAFGHRWARAHANCYETLPFIIAILFVAQVTGTNEFTDPLAMIVLGARLLQSIVHIISTSAAAVTLRATLFLTQTLIAVYWTVNIVAAHMFIAQPMGG